MRSPNNCVASRMYGVSPQPTQAPENSKSGGNSMAPGTVPRLTMRRS